MTSPAHGRSLELHYINGQPDGMLTAEMFNWTGHVLLVPRTQLSQALARTEAGYGGIYLLLGEKEGEPLAYVGESEDIGSRIKSHDAAKDWWSMAVLVTTAGNKLNEAHVRYLEARLIEQAKSVGRTPLDNGTSPPRPTLSEADVSKMEAFLENIFILLPAVRVDLFIQRTRPTPTVAPTAKAPSAEFILETKKARGESESRAGGRRICRGSRINGAPRVGRRGLRDDELRPASPRASERGRLAAAGHSVRVREELRLQEPQCRGGGRQRTACERHGGMENAGRTDL